MIISVTGQNPVDSASQHITGLCAMVYKDESMHYDSCAYLATQIGISCSMQMYYGHCWYIIVSFYI